MKRALFIAALLVPGAFGDAAADDTKSRGKEKPKAGIEGAKPADKKTGRAPAAAAPAQSTKKERIIDFTKEEEIRGVLTKPEAELVGARRKVRSKSLLPIRLNFIPEMMKTVQEL